MSPAYAPTDAGRGDAVSGINRADSASVGGSDAAPCACRLQRQWRGWGRIPFGWLQNAIAGSVSTADRQVPHESLGAAYPPPRESCVRGADRAAVDKSFWSSCYAIAPPSR